MKSRPLQVFCGSLNTKKSAIALPDFNYFEISDDISIATYTFTTETQRLFLELPDNPFENSLIIENFNVKCPSFATNEENKMVNVVFVLKGINFLFGDDKYQTPEILTRRFGPESITQILLPELLTFHLSLLDVKTTHEQAKQAYLRRWAYQLAHAVTETLGDLFDSHLLSQFQKSDIHKIRLLAHSLKNNLHKTCPTLEEMATEADMSITKFKTIFREVFDASPHQYILNLKLNQALFLLKQHSLSISEIAYKVGFNHPSALTRLFQNKLGITPNQVVVKK